MVAMFDCESSNLSAYGYDAEESRLYIRFKERSLSFGVLPKTWLYDGVPASVHAAMDAAPSKGKFFIAEIKPNYAGRLATEDEVKCLE